MLQYSVVIPTYKRSQTIKKSIYSCLYQTQKPTEIIVIDDNGCDETEHIVKQISNNSSVNIVYHCNNKNMGACYSRNIGVSFCKCDWIAFNDSDDIWLPNKIEKINKNIENHGSKYSCFASAFFDVNNLKDIQYSPKFIFPPGTKTSSNSIHILSRVNLNSILVENIISTQTIVIRKDLFEKLDGFDEMLPRFQDWEFIIRLLSSDEAIVFDTSPLVLALKSSDSITRNFSSGLLARQSIYSKHSSTFSSFKLARFRYLASSILRACVYKDSSSLIYFLKKAIN